MLIPWEIILLETYIDFATLLMNGGGKMYNKYKTTSQPASRL